MRLLPAPFEVVMLRSVVNRCAWLEDASFSMKRPCNKTLASGRSGYCPKHDRVFKALIEPRLIELKEHELDKRASADC